MNERSIDEVLLSAGEAFETYSRAGRAPSEYVHRIRPLDIETWLDLTAGAASGPAARPETRPVEMRVAGTSVSIRLRSRRLLVDPGEFRDDLAGEAPPADILVTHAHADHSRALFEYLHVWPDCTVIMSEETLRLVSEPGHDGNLDSEALVRAVVTVRPEQTVSLWDTRVTAFEGGHCVGNLAYVVEDPSLDGAVLVAGECTGRPVGGFAHRIPTIPRVNTLLVEATHSDLAEYPTGLQKPNWHAFRDLLSLAENTGRSIVFGCSSLGEAQEVYAAFAFLQRDGVAVEHRLLCCGIRQSVSSLVEERGMPPWDLPVLKGFDLEPKAIHVCGAVFREEGAGFFFDQYRKCRGRGPFIWAVPARFSGWCPGEGSALEVYTHASVPEILSLCLTQRPTRVCLYGGGQKGSFLGSILRRQGFLVSDFAGAGGRVP